MADAGQDRQLVRRLLAVGWRYRRGCVALLAWQLVLTLLQLVGLALVGVGIDVIRGGVAGETRATDFPFGWRPPASWPPLTIVALVAVAVLVVGVARAVLSYGYSVAAAKFVQGRIVVDLRAEVYAKLQRLSFGFFDSHTSGSVINRVAGDVQQVRQFIDGVLVQVAIVVISLAFYLVYMLRIHVGLTLACLATTPWLWWASTRFSRSVRPEYDRNRELVDRLVLTLTENIQGVHVVKGFAREAAEIEKFQAANRAVRDQQRRIFWRVSTFTPLIGWLTQVNLAVVLAYGGYLVVADGLPLGAGLIVFSGLLTQFSNQVNNLAGIANSIQQSLSGGRRVFEVLDMPEEIASPPRPTRLGRARGTVRFESVSFAYAAGEPVLREIDFEVRPGQCAAILGATGAGKSTLLQLIPRFRDATAGRVLVDGHDVRELDLDDLRRNVGVVFQESFLFSNTIAANIAFGKPGATREEIERAARVAAADEFIRALPRGYDTMLGEGGTELSGGQRQRLAIARAVLLDPPILLLDDPTAAVDPHTEREILTALDQARAGRATVLVTHRLSALRRADVVYVLERGRIVEHGAHDDLMAQRGHYYRAAELQTEHVGA